MRLDLVHEEAHLLRLHHLLEEVAVGAVEPLDQLAHIEEAHAPIIDHRVHRGLIATPTRVVKGGFEFDARPVELELDLDEGGDFLLGDLRRVELRVEALERAADGPREAIDDDVVDEIDVRTPRGRALGDLEHLVRLEEHLVDLFALVADVVIARGQVPLELLLIVVGRVSLGALALEQRLLEPSGEHVLDVFHVRLESEERVIRVLHEGGRLAHKVVDRVALPGEVLLPLFERLVDHLELRSKQRLLHLEHRVHDVVVLVRDHLQAAALHAVRLCLLVELER